MIYGTADLFLGESQWGDEIEWRLVREYFGSDEEARSYMESEEIQGERAPAIVTPGRASRKTTTDESFPV